MRVWLVTGGEPLPIGGGVADRLYRTGSFAGHLASAGHDVIWWSPDFDHRRKRHFGTIMDTVESALSYRIKLLPSPGYSRNISLRRLFDHGVVGYRFARNAKIVPPPQIIVASLPTLELASRAVRYGNSKGVPVVLDLRDMWPELYIWHLPKSMQTIAKGVAYPLFRWRNDCLARASALWAISDDFLSWGLRCARRKRRENDGAFFMVDRSPAPEDGAVQEARLYWDKVLGQNQNGEIVGCFVGSISHQYDLATVASAAVAARRAGANIRFVIAGDGETLSSLAERYDATSGIIWPGWIDRMRLLALLERCHFGLDPMPARPDFEATINNKAVDYLKAGRGIVSCPDRGALARLLIENGCGISYPHGDVQALTKIFMKLAADHRVAAQWSIAARTFSQSELDPSRIYGSMTTCLERMVAEVQERAKDKLCHMR